MVTIKAPTAQQNNPVKRPPMDPSTSTERTKNQVYLDNSRLEQQAGFNISYENSFSAIKRDIMKETIDKKVKKPKLAINLQFEPIDEKPPGTMTGRGKTGSNTSKVSGSNKSKDN